MEGNKEIVKWLSHMSSEGSCTTIPNATLEKQQPLIDEIHQIMDTMNVQRTENPNLEYLRTAIAETTAEDTALAKEILELMNKLEINSQTLASDVKENLERVSVLLRSEGLSDTDETALVLSVDGKTVREKKERRINRAMMAKYKELLHRHSVLEDKLNYLKKNVESISNKIAEDEVEYKNEYSTYELLSAKLAEYNTTAGTLETEIGSLKLEELGPSKILEKLDKFMERKARLAELDQALTRYRDLPPNLLEAKALLENKQREYNEVTKKYDNMA